MSKKTGYGKTANHMHRKLIASLLVLTFALPAQVLAQGVPGPWFRAEPVTLPPMEPGVVECMLDGKQAAKTEVSTTGNAVGGFLGGLLFFGPIGAAIAYAAAGEPETPDALIMAQDGDDCKLAFIDGYQEEGKKRKRKAALLGGLVGTAALIWFVASISLD